MASSCAKHPYVPLVGVCASCLRERLTIRMACALEKGGAAGSPDSKALGSSILLCNGPAVDDDGDLSLGECNQKKLSYPLQNNIHGVPANCHRKAMSSDGIYQRNSFYSSHTYVEKGRDGKHGRCCLRGDQDDDASFSTKETPDRKRRSLVSWLSAFFSKRGEKQKATSRECSIASWRECTGCKGSIHRCCCSTHSNFPSVAGPLSWEQQPPPWCINNPTSSPFKLGASLCQPSTESARSPSKLPPLVNSALSTQSSSITTTPLSSRSTSSPLKLSQRCSSSPRTPRRGHPPSLLSQSRSPLRLPSLLSSTHTMMCDVSEQVEVDHGTPSPRSKRKLESIWFGVVVRNKWVVRLKRQFNARKRKPDQAEADSVRTSSARESTDYCRPSQSHYSLRACSHGQNYWLMEKSRSPTVALSRPSAAMRAGREIAEQGGGWGGGASASGREYAGWESYFSSNFNSLHVNRRRYNSAEYNAELLRFYLTPIRSNVSKLRSH